MKKPSFQSLKARILLQFGTIVLALSLLAGLLYASINSVKTVQVQLLSCTEEKMMLQKAVADHFQWAARLNSTINYGTEFTGSTDPQTCDFGKFLYSKEVQNDPEWREFIQTIEPFHNRIHAKAKEILEKNDLQLSQQIYLEEIRPTLEELVNTLNQHIEVWEKKVQASKQEMFQLMFLQTLAVVGQVVILLMLLTVAYFFFRREVIKPIMKIEQECGRLARGELSLDFIVACKNSDIRNLSSSLDRAIAEIKKYIDDISRVMGELSNHNFNIVLSQSFVGDFKPIENSIEKMLTDVSDVLKQMEVAAGEVANGSEQMTCSTQQLAQGTAEQANSVTALSESVAEISSQVTQNAQNSTEASTMVIEAAKAISASNVHMQKLEQAMNLIQVKSEDINKIIKTIEDLAFQTDILALNAAVEAARAGVAGKGFAVVADEVRNLAGKSAEAAKNTAVLIEDSVSSVKEGVKLTDITASQLLHAVDRMQQTTDLITKVTQASNEQASFISQVTAELAQVSCTIQTNSAASDESATASEALSGQADLMETLIASFKLQDDSGREGKS